ncbi:hypothetical protein LSH36_781g00010 [Paralvinella palmiformis]|uniref:Uncharacterized protein n=1 Tax=Paralvinella palmiformis TaxID=53620 RepID=A0AAD9J190_9ANNE|nr:hypothetical protein LSH36_781g00010 [Paralvinella palmiformis]
MQLIWYLVLLVAVSMGSSAAAGRSAKNLHKKVCPSRQFMKEMDFNKGLLEDRDFAMDIEHLCDAEMPASPDSERGHQKRRLLKNIEQLLRLNITHQLAESEPHLRRSCRIDAFPATALRKVHKCFGLTTFPKLPKSAKRLKKDEAGSGNQDVVAVPDLVVQSLGRHSRVHEGTKPASVERAAVGTTREHRARALDDRRGGHPVRKGHPGRGYGVGMRRSQTSTVQCLPRHTSRRREGDGRLPKADAVPQNRGRHDDGT